MLYVSRSLLTMKHLLRPTSLIPRNRTAFNASFSSSFAYGISEYACSTAPLFFLFHTLLCKFCMTMSAVLWLGVIGMYLSLQLLCGNSIGDLSCLLDILNLFNQSKVSGLIRQRNFKADFKTSLEFFIIH